MAEPDWNKYFSRLGSAAGQITGKCAGFPFTASISSSEARPVAGSPTLSA